VLNQARTAAPASTKNQQSKHTHSDVDQTELWSLLFLNVCIWMTTAVVNTASTLQALQQPLLSRTNTAMGPAIVRRDVKHVAQW
jgi:hypothetical protein